MTENFFHIAPSDYQAGTDLICWDRQVAAGLVTDADWKWVDAPVGFDGHVVCLFADEAEARDYLAEQGRTLLSITLDTDEWMVEQVAEGYPCIADQIDAQYIKVIA